MSRPMAPATAVIPEYSCLSVRYLLDLPVAARPAGEGSGHLRCPRYSPAGQAPTRYI